MFSRPFGHPRISTADVGFIYNGVEASSLGPSLHHALVPKGPPPRAPCFSPFLKLQKRLVGSCFEWGHAWLWVRDDDRRHMSSYGEAHPEWADMNPHVKGPQQDILL